MKKIISLALILAMVLSVSNVALAADVTVISFEELQNAITGASDGDIITISGEITATAAMTISKDITIKGGAITVSDANLTDLFTITTGSTLILGEGLTVTSQRAILWVDGGEVIVNGATLTQNGTKSNLAAFTDNGGTITVNSGMISRTGSDKVTISVSKSNAKLIVNGGEITGEGTAIYIKNGGSATIDGGSIYSNGYGTKSSAIAVEGAGSVATINDGNISTGENGAAAAYAGANGSTGGTLNIYGGTISSEANSYTVVAGINGTVNISGGTIEGGSTGGAVKSHEGNGDINISDGIIEGAIGTDGSASMEISGGTFTADPSAYVDGEAVADINGDSFVVGEDAIIEAAKDANDGNTEVTVTIKKGTVGFKSGEGLDGVNVKVEDGASATIDDEPVTDETTIETPHSHSLAYKYDDDGHWQECSDADCPDADKGKTETEAHTYTDGVCVCGKPEPAAPHSHSLAYKYDDDGHWQECSDADCPDADKGRTETEAHTYTDGVCVCGKEEPRSEDPQPEDPKPSTPVHSGHSIKVTYKGGNTFSTSKSAVPTAVEIDGVPVSFTGNGKTFTVDCIQPGTHRITVRWGSTSITTNFTADAAVTCIPTSIPKTGDVSAIGYALMAVIAAAGAMLRKQ